MKKFLFTIGFVTLPAFALVPLAAATNGCFGRECDAVYSITQPLDGYLIDEDTWESNPMSGDWMEFGGQQYWTIQLGKLGNREPDWIVGYISNQQKAVVLDANGNKILRAFTPAGGNVFELSNSSSASITVHNNTCAQYYLRVVIHATPRKPSLDAGSDTGDASSDSATKPD